MPFMRVNVSELRAFRRELKQVEKSLPKELTAAFKEAAKLVEGRARGAAPGRHAKAIRARATQRGAFIRIGPGRRGDSLAVFMGQRRRSGWYAQPRYSSSAGRQFEPWVGSQWDPGETGGSPYFVGPAINRSVDDVVELLGDRFETLAARAFS